MPVDLKALMLGSLLVFAAAAAGIAWGRRRNLLPALTSVGLLAVSVYVAVDILGDLAAGPRNTAAYAGAAPSVPNAALRPAVAEQLSLRTVNFVPVGRINCLRAGQEAERQAGNPQRRAELLEVARHVCRQVPGRDPAVRMQLARVYLALASEVHLDGERACRYYRQARLLARDLPQQELASVPDLQRAARRCP